MKWCSPSTNLVLAVDIQKSQIRSSTGKGMAYGVYQNLFAGYKHHPST